MFVTEFIRCRGGIRRTKRFPVEALEWNETARVVCWCSVMIEKEFFYDPRREAPRSPRYVLGAIFKHMSKAARLFGPAWIWSPHVLSELAFSAREIRFISTSTASNDGRWAR